MDNTFSRDSENILRSMQPLADARKYEKKDVSNILEQHGGRIEVKLH